MGVATTERWNSAHPPISGLDYFETELNVKFTNLMVSFNK